MKTTRLQIVLLTISLVAASSNGGENRWTRNGPEGAVITDLVIHPSAASTIYASTYGGGIYKSPDWGDTWTAINEGVTDLRVTSLAIDPKNAATLYAATDGGRLFQTTNGGGSWSRLASPAASIRLVAVDQSDSRILYLGTEKGLFASDDRGQTWTPRSPSDRNVLDLAVSESDASLLLAGTPSGLFESRNRGHDWTRKDLGGAMHVNAIAIDPRNSQNIFVTSERFFHSSQDGGRTWIQSARPDYVFTLTVDASRSGVAYAGATTGIFTTTDGGKTWQYLPALKTPVNVLLSVPGEPILYAGAQQGVFISNDDGASWRSQNFGLNAAYSRAVAFAPQNPLLIYAAAASGIARTSDGGETWTLLPTEIIEPSAVAIDPTASNTVYAAGYRGASKSTDGGETWVGIQPNIHRPSGANKIVIDPQNPANLYALLVDDGLSKSSDGGLTWSFINQGLPLAYYGLFAYSLAIDPTTPSTLYSSSDGAAKSTDSGATWKPINMGLSPSVTPTSIAVDPINPSFVYAGSWEGLYRSSDGGQTWKNAGAGITTRSLSDVIVDPVDPSTVYASTYDAGIFRSANRGDTWAPFNEGLTTLQVNSVAVDSTGRFLAAGTAAGVFTYEFGFTSPPGLEIRRLPADPARIPRLLNELQGLVESSAQSSSALLIPVAGHTVGAEGTFFRSDITFANWEGDAQDVLVAWLAEGSNGTNAPSFRMTIPSSASNLQSLLSRPVVTVNDFVGTLGFSGVGSLLLIAIDEGENLDGTASIHAYSRIWTLQKSGSGTASQSASAVPLQSLRGRSRAALGLRQDQAFRTNIGVVNLDAASRSFRIELIGAEKSTTLDLEIPAFSMKQLPVPDDADDYGSLAAAFSLPGDETGMVFWTAYGSSVDNISGDGWTSLAEKIETTQPAQTLSGEWTGIISNAADPMDCQAPCPNTELIAGTMQQSGSALAGDFSGACSRFLHFDGSIEGGSLTGEVTLTFPQETFRGSATGSASFFRIQLNATLRSQLGHTIPGFQIVLTR